MGSLERVLENAPSGDSLILLADFNAHIGNDSKTWRGVVGKNGPTDLKSVSGLLLLDFCAHQGLSINTIFRHKGVHMCTWHQNTLGSNLIINFVVVDLGPHVQVKRGAELSADHHACPHVRSRCPGGRRGTLSPNGPCSVPPLLRCSVSVVAATPAPAGGHWRWGRLSS